MFQFLIGSLKTKAGLKQDAREKKFQFLIGSLKTFHIFNLLHQILWFQFLIGSLKTSTLAARIVQKE